MYLRRLSHLTIRLSDSSNEKPCFYDPKYLLGTVLEEKKEKEERERKKESVVAAYLAPNVTFVA